MNTGGGAQAYLGRDGTLLYVAGARTDDRTLVWVDRNGTEELIDAPPGQYRSPRVSPDGDRILVQVTQGAGADIHVFDVARGLLSPVTSHPALDAFPLWTPAGDHIVFRSDRDLPGGVFRKASVGTGAEERIYFDPQRQVTPWSWSADGRTLLTSDFALVGPTGFDVGSLTMDGEWTPLVQGVATEYSPEASPFPPPGQHVHATQRRWSRARRN